MKTAGIGGVKIATLYPLAGFRNLSYLSDEHIADIRFAGRGLRQI